MNLNNIFNKIRSDIFISGGKRQYYNSGLTVNGEWIVSGSIGCGGQYDLVGIGGYSPVRDSGTIKTKDLWQGSWAKLSGKGRDLFFNYETVNSPEKFVGTNARLAMFDPDILNDLESELDFQYLIIPTYAIEKAIPKGDLHKVYGINIFDLGWHSKDVVPWGNKYQYPPVLNLRRLNERGNFKDGNWTSDPLCGEFIKFVIRLKKGGGPINATNVDIKISMEIHDSGAPSCFASDFE